MRCFILEEDMKNWASHVLLRTSFPYFQLSLSLYYKILISNCPFQQYQSLYILISKPHLPRLCLNPMIPPRFIQYREVLPLQVRCVTIAHRYMSVTSDYTLLVLHQRAEALRDKLCALNFKSINKIKINDDEIK